MKKLYIKYLNLSLPVKASFWFVICNILQKGISVITTPIFTRLLTPEEYGVFTVYQSWYSIIVIFATLNLFSGVYNKGLIKYKNEIPKFSSSMIGLTIFCTFIITMFFLINKTFWQNLLGLSSDYIFLILIQSLGTAAFSFWAKEERFSFRYKKLVALTVVTSLLSPMLAIILIISTNRYKAEARVFAFVFVNAVVGIYFIFSYLKKDKHLYDRKFWKYALCYSLPLIPHYLSQIVLSQSDRIMISNMIGVKEAGIYGVSYTVSMIMTFITNALNDTIIPYTFQKLKIGDYAAIRKISTLCILLTASGCGVVILLAPEIIKVIATPEYYDAIMIIPAVSSSVYFMFIFTLYANIEFYYEKTKNIMYASIFAAIINIVLNSIFIKLYGYYAAGYTTLFCYVIYSFLHMNFANRIVKKNIGIKRIYNDKLVIIISIILILYTILVVFIYKYIVLRYLLLIIIIVFFFVKRNEMKILYDKLKNKTI